MKIIGSALVLLLAYLLQIKFRTLGLGFENAVLVALIVLAFVLRASELSIYVAAAVWFLNVSSLWSVEIVALIGIPFAVNLLRGIFPGSALFGAALTGGIGVGVWFTVIDVKFPMQFPWLFMGEIAWGIIWGILFFGILWVLRLVK